MPRDFHTPVPFGLRLVAAGLMTVLAMLTAMPVGAQELHPDDPPQVMDDLSCGHFETQADAQEALDHGNLDDLGRQSIDRNGDGTACEDAFLDPNSPPPARDYVSCGHFDSQESAQAALDSGDLDELGMQSLDGDGDGIACDVRWGEPVAAPAPGPAPTGVATLPNTGTGIVSSSGDSGFLIALMLILSGGLLRLGRSVANR